MRCLPVLLLLVPAAAIADDETRGSSFLLEEAYNQSPGVAQHRLRSRLSTDHQDEGARALELTVAQEWPIGSERHQLSWELPWSGEYDAKDRWEPCCSGVDDLRINYRYALLLEDPDFPALTPRFTVIVPTGDEKTGHSNGEIGFGFGVPMSKEAGPFSLHANTAIEWTPGVSPELAIGVRARERDVIRLAMGGSAILILHPRMQPMVEVLSTWGDEIEDTGLVRRTRETFVSPGLRWGTPLGGGNVVLGFAAPIGVGEESPPWSALLYFSFEHAFRRE